MSIAGMESRQMLRPRRSANRPTYFFKVALLACFTRGLVLLLFLPKAPSVWLFDQASELRSLAQSILHGQGLSSPFGGNTGPSAFLAPGYPAIIALVFRLFGYATHNSAIAILCLQALFGVGTVLALMLAARIAFGDKVAKMTGIFWAISPPLLWLPTIFWETSLSIMLLTATLAAAFTCVHSPTIGRYVALGSIAGFSLLVNPSLVTILLILLIWVLYKNYQDFTILNLNVLNLSSFLPLAVCFLIFIPWPIRNEVSMQAFIPFRSNMGYELWQGNRPESKGFFSPYLHPNINQAEFKRYAALGEVAYMKEKSQLAEAAIRDNPARFIQLTFKRFLCFWTGFNDQGLSIFIVTHITITSLLAIAGLISMAKRRHATTLLFVAALLVFPIPYYLTHPDPRFRLVIDPLTTLLAAYALASNKTALDPLSNQQ